MIGACPLCGEAATDRLGADRRRAYGQCPSCALIFAEPAAHLDAAAEKAIYDWHENSPADAGYRKFLNQLAAPLLERIGAMPQTGLDYGAGPGPTLSVMLAEAGHRMAIYDPFYAPDRGVLDARYDFVTCTETVEHFNTPGREWARLVRLLRPGGWLGVMTKLAPPADDFLDWHYKNDPTHVAFYRPATIDWIARSHELCAEILSSRVVLFQKPRRRQSAR